MVNKIIRFEGLFIFLASLYFYHVSEGSWLLFILLWIIPDISMIGYLIDNKWGAIFYNAVHTYILSIVLILFGQITDNPLVLSLGLIHTSHIGLDRLVGYGLKYPKSFKNTHIQKL